MRVLRLVIVGLMLAGQFPMGANQGPSMEGLARSNSTTAPPAMTPPAPPTPTDSGSNCTLEHAAATEITGVQPRVGVTASIVALDTGASYDETVVRYRVTFAQPDAVTNLTVKPHMADIVETAGFTRSGTWFTSENETASLTVHVEPRVAQFGWAFVEPPVAAYRWTIGGDQYCTYTMAERTPLIMTAPPGLNVSYTQQGVLLSPGQHVSRAVTVDGTTVRIVYDANRSGPQFDPARVEAELAQVACHVDVAAATERVTVFALPASAPGPAVTYGQGLDPSARTVTVSTARPIGKTGDVWTHEYVHTLQTFTVGERMQWFVEGSAEYYAHLFQYQLAVHHDSSLARDHAESLIRNVRHTHESVLTDPATWKRDIQYYQGAAAVLVLDNRLREASNGTYTMGDVFRWMNTHEGMVTYEEFRRRLVRWGNAAIGRWLDTHVAGYAAYSTEDIAMPSTGPVTHAEHTTCGLRNLKGGQE